MGENEARRRARRQPRGLRREEQIIEAAGALFAEHGYDKVTTNMVAARAGVSPGSLYQFFPNKEAVAHAFAAAATERLHQVYDAVLSAESTALPFPSYLDAFVDALIAFNRRNPGYLALALASTISRPLASALADLHGGIFARLDAVLATLWPWSTPDQRRLPGLISYRLFVAVLPLALEGPADQQRAVVQELKTALQRYWEPIIAAQRASDPTTPDTAPSAADR